MSKFYELPDRQCSIAKLPLLLLLDYRTCYARAIFSPLCFVLELEISFHFSYFQWLCDVLIPECRTDTNQVAICRTSQGDRSVIITSNLTINHISESFSASTFLFNILPMCYIKNGRFVFRSFLSLHLPCSGKKIRVLGSAALHAMPEQRVLVTDECLL